MAMECSQDTAAAGKRLTGDQMSCTAQASRKIESFHKVQYQAGVVARQRDGWLAGWRLGVHLLVNAAT